MQHKSFQDAAHHADMIWPWSEIPALLQTCRESRKNELKRRRIFRQRILHVPLYLVPETDTLILGTSLNGYFDCLAPAYEGVLELIQNVTLSLRKWDRWDQVDSVRLHDRFPGLRSLTLLLPRDYSYWHAHLINGLLVSCLDGLTTEIMEEFKWYSSLYGWELQMVDADGNFLTPRCGGMDSDAILAELSDPAHFVYS